MSNLGWCIKCLDTFYMYKDDRNYLITGYCMMCRIKFCCARCMKDMGLKSSGTDMCVICLDKCEICGEPAKVACANCSKKYCYIECMKLDWKKHQKECKKDIRLNLTKSF